MPRVALVVPYFPPESSGGVFRALKLAPRLLTHGWSPVVFTVENPGTAQDDSLLQEVPTGVRVIRIPASAARRLQRGPLRRLGFAFEALGLTANSEAQWEQLAERLIEEHQKAPFDLVFSSSPPAAAHRAILAAMDAIAPATRPPWVADFRDPWRRGFTYRPASDAEASADVRDEGRTLHSASVITTTVFTSMLASCMEHSLNGERLVWVPNGYDQRDVTGLPSSPVPPSWPTREEPWRFGYAGSMYGAYNISIFIEGLAHLLEARPDLRGAVVLDCYGPRNKEFIARIGQPDLHGAVRYHGYIEHREVLERLAACHWVLVAMPQDPRAQDTVSGKLYEFLAARMPVLAFVSPDGAIAKLLHDTQGGRVLAHQDPKEVAVELARLIDGGGGVAQLPEAPVSYLPFLERYSRDTVAEEFVQVFGRAIRESRVIPS